MPKFSTDSANLQNTIANYDKAYKEINDALDCLVCLKELLDANLAGEEFQLSGQGRDGLVTLLDGINGKLEATLYEHLPIRSEFAKLCGGVDHE